jgi:3'-phosphoadenosine 5'-phosphosulfate sulfotransferase (PAPS reductase)/FAD synthetase
VKPYPTCKHDLDTLKSLQALDLDTKVLEARTRIAEWHDYWDGQVYISFSGGKDSTVLLDLVRRDFPDVPAVFVNTGLEFPEVVKFVRQTPGVTCLRPEMTFKKVLETYGYPVASKEVAQKLWEYRHTKSEKLRNKRWNGDDNRYRSGKIPEKWKFLADAPFETCHKCCDVMKKKPMKRYERESGRKGYIGMLAADSHFRKQTYLRGGCNAYEGRSRSMPLAFWMEDDIWEYLKTREVPYSTIYDMGYENTGCVFCAFGAHLHQPNKFQQLSQTHPRLHRYCMGKLGMKEVLDFCRIPTGCKNQPSEEEADERDQ